MLVTSAKKVSINIISILLKSKECLCWNCPRDFHCTFLRRVNACVDDRHVFSVIPVVIEGMNRKMPVVVLLCVVWWLMPTLLISLGVCWMALFWQLMMLPSLCCRIYTACV